MIINKYPAPANETAAERYDRDWLNIPDLDTDGFDDLRHDRTLLQQHIERKSRRYVDDGVSTVTGGPPVFDPNEPGDAELPIPENTIFVENFDGPDFSSDWLVSGMIEAFAFSPEGLTLSDGYAEAKAQYPVTWTSNSEIFIDVKDKHSDAYYGVHNVTMFGFVFGLMDGGQTKQIGINSYGLLADEEKGWEKTFSVYPGGPSFTDSGSEPITMSGRHTLKVAGGKIQWWHNDALVAELDSGEIPSSMYAIVGFQNYGGYIERFGIIDNSV